MAVLSTPLDRDSPVRRPEALCGDLRLRPVDIRLRVEGLPLEVHELDDVAVDEPQTPDARARKEVRGHAPEGAQPDHDRMGRREPALARLADLREDVRIGVRRQPERLADLPEIDVELVAPRVPEGRELHGEAPTVELASEDFAVRDDLSRIRAAERAHLLQDLRGRCDPVPVRVVLELPREVPHRSLESSRAVREEDPALGPGERLVRARAEDVDALDQRLLELPARDEAEDVRRIVAQERADIVARPAEPSKVVREQDEARADE